MAENKRYYWLKLPKDFFEDRAIKKLRTIAGGDTYTIIYLKMLLKSLEDNGKFIYEGIEESIAEEIALDIDEKEDDVAITMNYLIQKGLMICTDVEAELTQMPELIGSESESAKRVRKHRMLQSNVLPLQCNANVTTCNGDVIECNTEIEKELDIEIKKDIDIENKKESKETKAKRFCKPTLDEVKNYIQESNLNVNAQYWYDYYESNGWMVGKNHMKDWKACIRRWNKTEMNNVKPTTKITKFDV